MNELSLNSLPSAHTQTVSGDFHNLTKRMKYITIIIFILSGCAQTTQSNNELIISDSLTSKSFFCSIVFSYSCPQETRSKIVNVRIIVLIFGSTKIAGNGLRVSRGQGIQR